MLHQDLDQPTPRARRAGRTPSPALPGITEISQADRRTLLSWWRALFAIEAPKGLSQSFLRRFVAFEVQARQKGGLSKSLHAQVQKIDLGQERRAPASLRPGARLLRDWNGVTHVVDITPQGCLWNGSSYRSLSAVARAITGAQWSGPRFFGLRDHSAGPSDPPSRRATSTRTGHAGRIRRHA